MDTHQLKARRVQCPYCGERIDVLLDLSVSEQSYIEDCQVCCQPIEFNLFIAEDDSIKLRLSTDDE